MTSSPAVLPASPLLSELGPAVASSAATALVALVVLVGALAFASYTAAGLLLLSPQDRRTCLRRGLPGLRRAALHGITLGRPGDADPTAAPVTLHLLDGRTDDTRTDASPCHD